MAVEPVILEDASPKPNQVDRQQVPNGRSDERTKTVRHPRWTRQETYVLIEGKKVVENELQRGRRSSSASGPEHFEPKWDFVSSFCRQRGVSRGPVQCRKRWSNLLVDFKKIRNWESQIKRETESFWLMRNDVRRDRKLPGFFDREVYNVLDGNAVTATDACPVSLFIPPSADGNNGDAAEDAAADEEEDEEEEPGKVADGLHHDVAEDGLSSDSEESGQKETAIKSKKQNIIQETPTKAVTMPTPGTTKAKRSLDSNTCGENVSQEKRKQRRLSVDGCEDNYSDQLIGVLERNSNMLSAQLEAHNLNCQLDREQRKEQSNSLLAAIGKVTDALVRIADKLK